jgi:hypothetical protein
MPLPVREQLTDAVFKAALEPDAWGEVTRLMQIRFPSEAQTFYFLDMQPRQVRPIFLQGVEPRRVESFDSLYFAPDNPWIRMAKQLHRCARTVDDGHATDPLRAGGNELGSLLLG